MKCWELCGGVHLEYGKNWGEFGWSIFSIREYASLHGRMTSREDCSQQT